VVDFVCETQNLAGADGNAFIVQGGGRIGARVGLMLLPPTQVEVERLDVPGTPLVYTLRDTRPAVRPSRLRR